MPTDTNLTIEIDNDLYVELCKLAEERKMSVEDLVAEIINHMVDHDAN